MWSKREMGGGREGEDRNLDIQAIIELSFFFLTRIVQYAFVSDI